MKNNVLLKICLVAVVASCWVSCSKEPLDKSLPESGRINQFIVDGVQTYYLWEAETNWKDYEKSSTFANEDHYKLFDRLLYKDDYWSALTEDGQGLENQFAGVSTTFGYTLKFNYHPFTNNNEVVAIVLYTSFGSPAAQTGLKRGDVIIELNGNKLTTNNYRELYLASSIRVRCGQVDEASRTISTLPEEFFLTAINMYENPINTCKIIEKEGHKIGYLCYTGYQRDSENELYQLFSDFKSAGVSDVVLDLRYNTGGYSRTAQILSSILAPEAVVKNKRIYLEHHYNKQYAEYLMKNDYLLYDTFVDTLPVNMNLSRLYVLTGKNTASASEATMVGLAPYLQVIQIGDTTAGKYCGGIILMPEDIYGSRNKSYYELFSNWGMYIMIYRYANINGITSFTAGLVPDMLAIENPFALKPFGDEDDPLLGRALARIMGTPYVESRAANISVPLITLSITKNPVDGMLIDAPPFLLENSLLNLR